jgi:hypothetical protein
MGKQDRPRLTSYVAVVAVVSLCTSCHTLKAQLAALKGQSADSTASSGQGAPQSKVLQFWGSHSTPILDRNYRSVHQPSASGGPLKFSTPHFDWTGHSGAGGGTFQDPQPSSSRPQRSAVSRHSKT